jgi:hypothetical protein
MAEGDDNNKEEPKSGVTEGQEVVSEKSVTISKDGKDVKDATKPSGDQDSKDKKEEGSTGPPPVPVLQLFRFADRNERFMMAVGAFASVILGIIDPLNF